MARDFNLAKLLTDDGLTIATDVVFDTNTLFIDSDNNRVGIGNIVPATPLDVTGTITADGLTVDGDATLQSDSPDLIFIDTDGPYQSRLTQSGTHLYISNETTGAIRLRTDVNKDRLYVGNNGDIIFYEDTGTSQKFFWDASAESLGIGTTSPSAKLNVVGSGRFDNSAATPVRLHINNSGSNDYASIYADTATAYKNLVLNPNGGNVGIGTSSPSSLLHLKGSTSKITLEDSDVAGATCIIQGGGAGNLTLAADPDNAVASSYITFQVDASEAMRIDSSGTLIHKAAAIFNEDGGNSDFRVESDSESGALMVDANTNEVLVGKTSGDGTTRGSIFNFNGTGRFYQFMTDATATSTNAIMYLNRQSSDGVSVYFRRANSPVGNISVTTSGTTYNTTSDRRLKDNIESITDGTEKLMAMNPVTHTWKNVPDAPAVHGFIAQEMMNVVPEAVSGDPEGEEMMSMDYGRITPVLVAALQDAIKEITALKERLSELEAK